MIWANVPLQPEGGVEIKAAGAPRGVMPFFVDAVAHYQLPGEGALKLAAEQQKREDVVKAASRKEARRKADAEMGDEIPRIQAPVVSLGEERWKVIKPTSTFDVQQIDR